MKKGDQRRRGGPPSRKTVPALSAQDPPPRRAPALTEDRLNSEAVIPRSVSGHRARVVEEKLDVDLVEVEGDSSLV